MTRTRGSEGRMATTERIRLKRFTRTERAVHWVHATAFLILFASGLALYLPSLAEAVGRRPVLKTIHLYTAIAWLVALVAVVVVGDRRSLRATVHEIDTFDRDDRNWLRHRPAPQGRLNAGQKLNAIITAAFAVLVRGHRSAALVRRARHALPLRPDDPDPRLADVHLVLALPGSPLPERHPPEDAPCADRHHPRVGLCRLGAQASRQVGRRSGRPDALSEVEEVVRVVLLLHRAQPRQVRPVVRLLPIREGGVDVVHVRSPGTAGFSAARELFTHARADAPFPAAKY